VSGDACRAAGLPYAAPPRAPRRPAPPLGPPPPIPNGHSLSLTRSRTNTGTDNPYAYSSFNGRTLNAVLDY